MVLPKIPFRHEIIYKYDKNRGLFKVRRPPLDPLTLLAFGDVFDLAAFKKGLHLNFSAARTEEFLGRTGSTGVFTGLSHGFISLPYKALLLYIQDI
jgi:hypothetical protein